MLVLIYIGPMKLSGEEDSLIRVKCDMYFQCPRTLTRFCAFHRNPSEPFFHPAHAPEQNALGQIPP